MNDVGIEAPPRAPIEGGPPPDFGGTDTRWSPEHLLVAAAGLCFIATLESFAMRRSVPILDLACRSEGSVERTPRGLAFTSVSLHVAATAAKGQVGVLRDLLQEAKQHCLVANSLSCPVSLVAEVSERAVPEELGQDASCGGCAGGR